MYGERAALITVSKRALSSFHFVIHKINMKNKSLLFFSFSSKTVNCVIIDLFEKQTVYCRHGRVILYHVLPYYLVHLSLYKISCRVVIYIYKYNAVLFVIKVKNKRLDYYHARYFKEKRT